MMKKMKFILGFALIVNLLVISTGYAEEYNTGAYLNSPQVVAKQYFDAYIARDTNGMIQNSLDVSYSDENSRKTAYDDNAKVDTVASYEIVNTKEISDVQIDLHVKFSYTDIGEIPPIPYSLVKNAYGWKV